MPLSLALGTGIVIALYLLANVAYLVTLPLEAIQHAPADRVATATLDAILPGLGATLMAVAIMISTFGCNNGLILAGARAYYAMARDGLFFRGAGAQRRAGAVRGTGAAGRLGRAARPAPHVRPGHREYGNLYGNLLDYVISAALIFYILTIAGVFRLRQTRPTAAPLPRVRVPVVPASTSSLQEPRPSSSSCSCLPPGDDLAGAADRDARAAGIRVVRADHRPAGSLNAPSATIPGGVLHAILSAAILVTLATSAVIVPPGAGGASRARCRCPCSGS